MSAEEGHATPTEEAHVWQERVVGLLPKWTVDSFLIACKIPHLRLLEMLGRFRSWTLYSQVENTNRAS
jgi:hypothetical protein